MAGRDIPAAVAAVTVNGTAEGYVTVADNSVFAKGAKVWMTAAAATPVACEITDIGGGGAGTIGLRILPVETWDPKFSAKLLRPLRGPNYGRSDCTAFLSATPWSVRMDAQFVYSQNSVLQ